NAFVREHGISYSKFIDILKKENITLDRKTLSDLAVNNKAVLMEIINQVKK
ncbi:MAG: 50S ribosomal protein L20, partial [Patescibacteria group bacterium]